MRRSRLLPFLLTAALSAACGGGKAVEAGPDAGGTTGGDAPDAGDSAQFPQLTIDDVREAEGASGNSAFTFTVRLDHAPKPGEDVEVHWATEDGTATAGSDYAAGSGTLTFTGDSVSATITVQVTGDTTLEPDETFAVVLSNPLHATLGKARGIGTVLGDDFPTISIADASVPEGDSGSTDLSFTITLSAAPLDGHPLSVTWETSDGTATALQDYAFTSGMLTFAPGDGLTKTITVPVIGDTALEADETFVVTLSNPVNGTLGDGTATGTIKADDFPRITVADARRPEGGDYPAELVFEVTIDPLPPPGLDAYVHWSTVDGTALAGIDYWSASGTLTFRHGDPAQQSVMVNPIGDTLIEPDKTFSLHLSGAVHAVLGPDATGTIENDDWPQLSISGARAAEGDNGITDLAFSVSISDVPLDGQTATVDWATADGTAVAPEDYGAASGTVTFLPGGALTQTVHVSVAGDTDLEHDESFTVQLSHPHDAVFAAVEATGTIQNDDFPTATIADASVLEGTGSGSTNLAFTVSLDVLPLPGEDAQVTWTTSDGTAAAPGDYAASSGTLTFTSADALTRTVVVPLARDTDIEPDETLTVTLASPNRLKIGAKASATGTILADDFPTVSISNASGLEGDAGTSDFPFSLTLSATPPAGYPLTVDWATSDGTATAPADYLAGSGTVTFAPGDLTTRNVTVKVNGDTASEADETFRVTLTNAVHGTIATGQGTGTIRNDDVPRASISDARVQEGNFGTNELVFVVSLDSLPPAGQDAQLTWATADGSASAGSDYVASSGALTFTLAGPLSQRITVPIVGDTTPEQIEQFFVRLTAVANVRLLVGTGTGTIVDDELPAVSIDNITHSEGASGTTTPFVFTVSLSAAPQVGLDVSVPWSTGVLSAYAPGDYTAASGTLTFTAGGPTSQTITVNGVGNGTKELQKQFKVVLGNPANATLLDGLGLGTIVDDDGVIIRVDASATGTADGLTWATAYPTVQAGVDRASALGGGQVWVAAGTYNNGGGNGPVLTMKSLVSVIGGFDGFHGGTGAQETQLTARDPVAHPTTLDGVNTAWHVVIGTTAVLDGFTITGGNANSTATTNDGDPGRRGGGMDQTSGFVQVMNCVFRNNYAAGNGGAINTSTGLTVHDTKFLNNTSNNGGAIYASSTITVFDDFIQGNYAGQFNLGGGYGGGIQDVSQSTSTYTNTTFDNNHGTYGGGLHLTFGKSIVRGCTFTNNLAQGSLGASGGGLYDDSWSASKVYDSVFVGNRAGDNGGGLELRDSNTLVSGCRVENNTANYGAGIFIWDYFGGVEQIFNTRIAYNRAGTYGGGVYHLQASPVFVNCVFEGNDGNTKGGALYDVGSSPTLVNCDFLNDTAASGPEMQNDAGGSPTTNSVPVMTNSIILNRTSGIAAVSNTGGNLSASFSLNSDFGKDPHFNHVPLRASRTNSGSSATSLNVTGASTTFAVNDVVEVGNDGVARKVTAVTASAITISPALTAAPALYTHLDNWGPGATDLSTDLRLRADSACIDAGNNGAMKADAADLDGDGNLTELVPVDLLGKPRFVDDPTVTDLGMGPAPVIDVGAIERPAP